MHSLILMAGFGVVVLASLMVVPRRASVDGFFAGIGEAGCGPGLWVLVLSQVTTWIFARSLMNAAILGFSTASGALAYFARDGLFAALLPAGHKYEQLLAICVVVLVVGFTAVFAGARRNA